MTARKRLLLASQPIEAGVPRHVFDLVSCLDPAAYDIDVACPRGTELWMLLSGVGHVRLHHIAPDRHPALVDARTWILLRRLVRDADLIHAHSSKAGFLTRLAAAVQGRTRACVFTPHGWSFWSASGARARFYLGLERLAARWCHSILAVSAAERDAGIAAGVGGAGQYRVVANGIDLGRFEAPPSPVAGRVLMVGRLAPPKRPDLAVRAVAALADRSELALHLVGDGPQRAEVESLRAALGVEDRVHLLGTRSDVPRLLAEAACLLVPSDYEACPLSVLEAMAAGVPVVAARSGGIPDVVEHGVSGLLVEAGSPHGFAAALAEVLDDRERARRLGEAGRRKVRTLHTRERMAAAIEQVYRQIGGESGA